jgi:rod shape-determining protein MreC
LLRILNILAAFKEYCILVLLVIISLVLLGANDNLQIRTIRSTTVGFIGVLQNALSVIPNVINLKRENEILRQMNVNLSDEVNRLREARLENLRLREMQGMKEHSPFALVAADIVGKSLLLMRNTITLNMGEANGIRPDMPIINPSGVVGKVILTSAHYAIGQIMLNKDFRASVKIQRSRIDGIIAWDGVEGVHMKNVAMTQDVREGDIVTTSEYSNVFPPNIRIGVVSRVTAKAGNLFKEILVTPDVDFASLEQVFVIVTPRDPERIELEKKLLHMK